MSAPAARRHGGGVWRGTSNRDDRGSSYTRRERKAWLLRKFGNGEVAFCTNEGCTTLLTAETLTVERIVPACEGGTYERSNLAPMCGPCNSSLGGAMSSNKARAARARRSLAAEPEVLE